MKTLDCRTWQCPTPVIETRKLLLAEPGNSLTVLVADSSARENVSRLAQSLGYEVATDETNGSYTLHLTCSGSHAVATATSAAPGKTVLFVTGETLGSGSDELGHILLKNFLMTLIDATTHPDTILFVNGGVKLTVTGSDLLSTLNTLSSNGVDIASCGLCLEFYGIKDQLAVGRIGNLLETVETLHQAGRVIRL
ncbi:MAG: sulfurtransferase-like selenium metabolism protein YedF [Desulfuromonadales bacterium]|nr:sulfurtransferase-like selenium metabolism protein YedF [Desulfuromonadales bacterium]